MTILAPTSPLIGSAASKAEYRTFIYVALLSFAAGWFLAWPIWRAKVTALLVGFGLSACILQWFGHGVAGNAEFDLFLALGIGVGVAFTRIETTWLANGSARAVPGMR